MKFRMHLKPIEFEADSLEEANELCSEVLVKEQAEVTLIEQVATQTKEETIPSTVFHTTTETGIIHPLNTPPKRIIRTPGESQSPPKPKRQKKEKVVHHFFKGSKDRADYLTKQTKYYMQGYNWPRGKAMSQANSDWKNRSPLWMQPRTYTIGPLEIFPLSNKGIIDLTAMVGGMLNNYASHIQAEIRFKDIVRLELIGKYEWTTKLWHGFLLEFKQRSGKIAKLYAVEDKFTLLGSVVEGNEVLIYGD